MRLRKPDLISRSLILIGGALSASSGTLAWAKSESLASGMPAVFVSDSALLRRGFDLKMGWLSVGWAVALFGIGAIALLLWGGSGTQAAWIPRVQLGLGAAIVLIALLHAAPQPGVAVAAVGGGALAGGAILTLRRGAEQ